MAGDARSQQFLNGPATVMVGGIDELWDLRPDLHSLGLVHNVIIATDPQHVFLSQRNGDNPIFSVRGAENLTVQCQAHEKSARNIQIAAGNNPGSLSVASSFYSITTPVNVGDTVVRVAGADLRAVFTAGSWLMLQQGTSEHIHVSQLPHDATYVGGATIIPLATVIGAGNNFSLPAQVCACECITLNDNSHPRYLALKIVGFSHWGSKTPIVVAIPKARVVTGLGLKAGLAYSPLDMTFRAEILSQADKNYSRFGADVVGMIFAPYNRNFLSSSYAPVPSDTMKSWRRVRLPNGKNVIVKPNYLTVR